MEKKTHKICRFGDPVLQLKATEVTNIDDKILRLIEILKETMYQAPGVGLAAPQVGEAIQIATVDLSIGEQPDEFFILINPQILEEEGSVTDDEGCLSLPGFTLQVKRSQRILIRYLTLEGKEIEKEFLDLKARVVQHEIDHLQGTLILDRVSSLKRNLVKKEIKKRKTSGDW